MDGKKRSIVRIDPSSKIVLSIFVAFLWFLVTNGRPPNRNLLEGFSHFQTTRESIFQTAVAIEKKRFTKRIVEENKGYWSYIPYANQPKWIDLEIKLTTKIGFDIQNSDNFLIGTTPEGKHFIEVFEPTVIDKHWSTQVLDASDNFFNKWDIREYKMKEQQILAAIAEAQSQNILEEFKSDPGKMGQLTHLLDQKLHSKKSIFSLPLRWIDQLNSVIQNKVKQLKYSIFMTHPQPEVWNSADYKKKNEPQSTKPKNVYNSQGKGKERAQRQSKNIAYTPAQRKIRQQMRNRSSQ